MTLGEIAAAEGGEAPSPLHSAQERANIRLEVLRLAHRPDVPVEQVIERAGRLTAFVLGEQPADKP